MSRLCWLLLLLVPLAWATDPHQADRHAQARVPGYGDPAFPAPEPGRDRLPVLGEATDGEVLLESGGRSTLHKLFADKVVVMSFIYTRCPDPNGCPLAGQVLARLERALSQDPQLSRRVQLLSLSFDPANDRPHIMADYARRYRSPLGRWQFLTTDNRETLEPILNAYNPLEQPEQDPRGAATDFRSHRLGVYLIDDQRHIRNIYSTGLLHQELLLADIRTLLMEPRQPSADLQH